MPVSTRPSFKVREFLLSVFDNIIERNDNNQLICLAHKRFCYCNTNADTIKRTQYGEHVRSSTAGTC